MPKCLVGIHQPHYLPWLRYFEKIARCDVFIVLDTVQYSKNGWQNRNKIKSAQGAQLLTVPVHGNLSTPIKDIAIDTRQNWQRKHLQAIDQCYKKAPFFDDYMPMIRPFYERPWDNLAELNDAMLHMWNEALGITTPIMKASEMNAEGEATERLVNLVRLADGDAYYSGAFALDAYLDKATLDAAGIELVLQEWKAPVYEQRYGEFVADLAIVDLLMNCGGESLSQVSQ